MYRLAQLLLPLLLMAPQFAYALTGDDILNKCKASVEQPPEKEATQKAVTRFLDAGTCAGFVGGVLSGINLVGSMMLQQKLVSRNFVCVPENVHSHIFLQDVLKYLEKNPKEKELPAQLVIYNVFTKKYPCTSQSDAPK